MIIDARVKRIINFEKEKRSSFFNDTTTHFIEVGLDQFVELAAYATKRH